MELRGGYDQMFSIFIKYINPCFLSDQSHKSGSPLLETDSDKQSVENSSPLPRNIKDIQEVLLDHQFFQISYNQTHKLPNWVFYSLTAKNISISAASRRDRFLPDPLLVKKGITPLFPTAYAGTLYDRGHLAPSADFEWSQEANDSTFVMTNMAPQARSLNRQAWKYLESRVRKWACTEGELQIVTGPVFDDNLEKLPSGVSIPKRFFKVVLDNTPPRKSVGFIYNQDDSTDVYKSRAIPVDVVEKIVGFDFFSNIAKDEQSRIESVFNIESWVEGNCNFAKVASSQMTSSNLCKIGEIGTGSFQGCCSHHGGISGPKKGQTCCHESTRSVVCADGTLSKTCRCD